MTAKQVRAQYTQEFKLEAVRQVRAGQAIAVVAKVLGIPKAKDRVRKLMRQHGIRARTKRKFVVTTDSKHSWTRRLQSRRLLAKTGCCHWRLAVPRATGLGTSAMASSTCSLR